jgi:Secretion system C-terminal sorting domain
MLKKWLCIILSIGFSVADAMAVVRYVTPSGAGLMNGSSWTNAFPGTSLQIAISTSVAGDEVWVQSGTYFTTNTFNRTIYFSMVNGVAIYGSFNGTETLLSQRVFTCGFTSILSAEIGVPGNADNSYHVINNAGLNNSAVLDGFTITGGNANFDLTGIDNRSLGGGMLNFGANSSICSPTIRNCLFTNNSALFGGGIFNHGQNSGNANPIVTNCIIAFNAATDDGGGMDNFGYNGNASPVITNTIFYNNTAPDRAGALYCWGGGNGNASPTILNSVFVNNSAVNGGGIVSDRTNFVSGNSGTATPVVRNSIFWGNTASSTGPQFFTLGGAGFAATYTLINISNQNPPHIITGMGTGNIFTTPSFVNIADANGADDCWLTNDDGLQLQFGAVGIDAGDNTGVPAFDIRNYNRIANAAVDMGAYEFNASVLPVRLISFYGRAENNTNRLYWVTAEENNHLLFEIQRSSDAVQFEKIAGVTDAVSSGSLKQYQYTDDRINRKQYYYRLKQIDVDGRYTFSAVILLASKSNNHSVVVFPNPVVNTATITFHQALVNETFSLLNANGQLIDKLLVNGKTAAINLNGKAAGLYLLVNQKLGITVKIQKAF